ncbi:cerebellar degeneration-related protein 2-like isoform 2-T2 [Cochliomyia hominivorax]
MASYNELQFDWNILFQQQDYDQWSKTDLQLAAELGKTLLERNKELETLLKEHKHTIEEQEQEIVYLKKHTTALREVNDSRLKVYEQLEVGIQDLERANHRLLVENTADKKHIKTLGHNIETLEARCEELTKQLEECRQSLTVERRKNERLMAEKSKAGSDANTVKLKSTANKDNLSSPSDTVQTGYDANTTAPENCSFAFASPASKNNANSTGISGVDGDSSFDLSMVCGQEGNDEIIKLVSDLETTKRAFMAEQQRCGELEEQLVAIIQENQSLQSRIAQTSATEEMKSMHDELSILDEVRQGQMCSRCLRSMDDRLNDEQSSLAPTEECEEDEERSLLDLEGNRDDNASEHSQAAYRSSMSIKVTPQHPDSLDLNIPGSPNPYRDLVEKYEALLEVQRSSIARKNNHNSGTIGGGMSLAEEFQSSGEFAQTQKLMFQAAHGENSANCNVSTNGDAASSCNGSMNNDSNNSNTKNDKNRGRTPTEFSEAETSSSGFSDETSNKGTQTDERPGYFLCSIGDGEDCKFSIYDDASPIDSRFRNRPEYRELFKEIFAVLKKAAENKEEGDKLPLLDDAHPNGVNAQKVPPVTPANEELPVDFADDAQSIISSAVSEQSFAMSECITKLERKTAKKHIIEKNQENKPPMASSIAQLTSPSGKQIIENGRILTPLKREPLDYLAVGVGIKKKNRRKNRNFSSDRSESPLALPTPPRFFVSSGKKRKEVRPFVESPMAATPDPYNTPGSSRGSRSGPKYEWNGNSMIIYNRSVRGRSSSGEVDVTNIHYRPSTVSQDLHKLKKLDLSYAEVLRRADACKQHHHNQYQQQQRRKNHRH